MVARSPLMPVDLHGTRTLGEFTSVEIQASVGTTPKVSACKTVET
jgi:hypothetical protein